ncbi:MAG: xanthine dehydrogenase [Bacilli bacterium]
MNEPIFKEAEYILYNYKYINSKLDIIELKINNLKNNVDLSAIDYSKDKISSTNAFSSSVENEVIKRENKLKDLEEEKRQLLYQQHLVDKVMNLLEEEEKRIVELRYFTKPKRSWTSIQNELNLSPDTAYRKRRNIINRIAKYLI